MRRHLYDLMASLLYGTLVTLAYRGRHYPGPDTVSGRTNRKEAS